MGKTREILKIVVELLAAIPSIVWGFIGLTVMNPLIQKVFGVQVGLNILNAAILLALMSIPVIVSIGEDALKAVPDSYREASIALGATRWQTIWGIVLPNSISGILTGVILQVSRTAGETAPIMFTGAVFYKKIEEGNFFAYGLNDQCMALSMHLFTVTTQVTNAPHALPFAIATVLLGLVLTVNLTAIIVRSWLRGRRKW